MADVHIYFGIENLALTNAQRNTLAAELFALGREDGSPYPNRRMQRRIRLDNQAMIFEAVFDETHLTATAIRNRLATIFGVAANTITFSTTTVQLAGRPTMLVTFTRLGTDYLRMVAFGYNGGGWPIWELSRQAAVAYLTANAAEWESPI